MNETVVMKFGGAAVATTERFSTIADLIVKRRASCKRMIVVISAMAHTTDQLIKLAKEVNEDPPQREYDMLVSVGERISMSLLAMALAKKGVRAVSFTGSQAGIITCPRHTDARITEVRPGRLLACLDAEQVVIVAGFQGVSSNGEITTLGRGGSDTSAVALGIALGGVVEFYKDVAGIYDCDPKKKSDACLLKSLSYEDALDIVRSGAQVLHPRCIELAQQNGIPLIVRSFLTSSFNEGEGTTIGESRSVEIIEPLYEK